MKLLSNRAAQIGYLLAFVLVLGGLAWPQSGGYISSGPGGLVPVTSGGTGLSGGTTGGWPYFSNTNVISETGAGVTTDGVSVLTLGVAGTSVGGVAIKNATSGTITVNPPTGALGTPTLTLPATTAGLPVLFDCGSTGSGNQTCTAAAANGLTKIVTGHSTLATNAAVITFPNSVAFTSSTSYECVANDITTRANPVQMLTTSTTTATITNTTGASDVISWICMGY